MAIAEQVNAGKEKLGPEQALALAHRASKIWVARGKKVLHFDMKKDPPSDEELLGVILGRSQTLRAPTIVSGKKLLVGFNAGAFTEVFG